MDYRIFWISQDEQGNIPMGEYASREAAERELPLHQRGVIALDKGTIKAAILDRPAVHEQVLVGARRA